MSSPTMLPLSSSRGRMRPRLLAWPGLCWHRCRLHRHSAYLGVIQQWRHRVLVYLVHQSFYSYPHPSLTWHISVMIGDGYIPSLQTAIQCRWHRGAATLHTDVTPTREVWRLNILTGCRAGTDVHWNLFWKSSLIQLVDKYQACGEVTYWIWISYRNMHILPP